MARLVRSRMLGMVAERINGGPLRPGQSVTLPNGATVTNSGASWPYVNDDVDIPMMAEESEPDPEAGLTRCIYGTNNAKWNE